MPICRLEVCEGRFPRSDGSYSTSESLLVSSAFRILSLQPSAQGSLEDHHIPHSHLEVHPTLRTYLIDASEMLRTEDSLVSSRFRDDVYLA